MKDLKGIKGKFYIAKLIEEGEHVHQDFKFSISDARKIARSLSAFANNDGGRLLVGVKDNGVIAGVRNEEDIYVIEQAAEMFCSPAQHIDVAAFKCDGGLTVFRVEIAKSAVRPVMVHETDGSWKAYYRVKDENISAPELMVRAWERAAENTGILIELNDAERQLLQQASVRPVKLEDFMVLAHISHAAAEEMVIRLHAMGVLDFSYDGTRFNLIASPQ
ncbi:MAG: ATP-binding protein [Duncaniella sp.]|nr:ATP-binding protein [Muribaculum sp.]MCM1256119.1 ATP-binding protein [Duncaniella sp.]